MNGTKRRSQSGLVLIVTLLVALGLSLIGAIIMERTRTDTATSGSLRAAEQTYLEIADMFDGFSLIECVENDQLLTIEQIHQMVWSAIQPILQTEKVIN